MYHLYPPPPQVPVVQNTASALQSGAVHGAQSMSKMSGRPGHHTPEPQNHRTAQVGYSIAQVGYSTGSFRVPFVPWVGHNASWAGARKPKLGDGIEQRFLIFCMRTISQ